MKVITRAAEADTPALQARIDYDEEGAFVVLESPDGAAWPPLARGAQVLYVRSRRPGHWTCQIKLDNREWTIPAYVVHSHGE